MKLLENIVKNVQRENIPPDAKWFVQDVCNQCVKFSRLENKPDFSTHVDQWYRGEVKASEDKLEPLELSEDATTTVVTYEELMRAYDLVEQGYTLWFGGERPVTNGSLVHVIFGDGYKFTYYDVTVLSWQTVCEPNNIIAYKVIEPETPVKGVKYDSGKPRFSLLPLKQVWQIVEVLEFGAKKYAPDNWQKVDNKHERYFNAAQRHLTAWWQGEKKDPETGLSHLAHVAYCVLFLMWGDDNEK